MTNDTHNPDTTPQDAQSVKTVYTTLGSDNASTEGHTVDTKNKYQAEDLMMAYQQGYKQAASGFYLATNSDVVRMIELLKGLQK